MYFDGVNPVKAFLKEPSLARHFFIDSAIRVLFLRLTGRKLRLPIYAGKIVKSTELANSELGNAIRENIPFMAARFGSGELSVVSQALLKRTGLLQKLDMDNLQTVCTHSGLFPPSEETAMRFLHIMLESVRRLDLIGAWRMAMEDYLIRHYAPDSVFLTHRHVFDFWLSDAPFTSALVGKKVLVIHPFEQSIRAQYARRDKLFERENVLPEFELKTVRAVQSIAGTDCGFASWFDALDAMYEQAMATDFDVALLGCGAYGFPLAARLKMAGKTALHMGGVTQMLFGIKGRRWDDDPAASRLYNRYWIRPDPTEVPPGSAEVENGCYW